MKTTLLALLFLLVGFHGFGQDTIRPKDPFIDRHSLSPSTEKQLSVRVGLGLRNSFYADLGVALHACTFSDVGFFSRDVYTALEWIPSKNESVYGLKIGCHANAYLLNVGLEVKYQTDFLNRDFVITPKIGFGLYGDLNLFYGYNFSTNHRPFPEIGRHQFSLVLNINRHFLQYR